MSDTGNIPQSMIDNGAKSMHARLRREYGDGGGPPWEQLAEDSQDYYRRCFTADLAAAFAECEVREEWGYRSQWTKTKPAWREQQNMADKDIDTFFPASRDLALLYVGQAEAVPRALIRRLVVVTPAQEGTQDGS